jgi:negative regulator of replication initiation
LGRRIGAKSSGTAGSVSIQLPRKVPAADLWVVATTNAGRALIPLRP